MAKKLTFYKLAVEIAANKTLTHSEKLITAYLFTLFGNDRDFHGTNAHLSVKLDVKKSSISVCLKKLQQMGWISISNPKSNKRRITMLDNPCIGGNFYQLYSVVAESQDLTALEKILLSYILSFIDNGKRFYAKNEMVKHTLDISKEGFNTSRIKFEELQWIKVLYPKSPRRELIVLNHPTENMPTELRRARNNDAVTDNVSDDHLENKKELPNNNNALPENNDNYISNNRNNKRNINIEANKDFNKTVISSSSNLISNKVEEKTSTKDASAEATASTVSESNAEEHTSTKKEAHASITHEVEPPSTKDASIEATASPLNKSNSEATTSMKEGSSMNSSNINNNIDEGATDSISGSLVVDEETFDVCEYMTPQERNRLSCYIEKSNLRQPNGKPYRYQEAINLVYSSTKDEVDELLLEMTNASKANKISLQLGKDSLTNTSTADLTNSIVVASSSVKKENITGVSFVSGDVDSNKTFDVLDYLSESDYRLLKTHIENVGKSLGRKSMMNPNSDSYIKELDKSNIDQQLSRAKANQY